MSRPPLADARIAVTGGLLLVTRAEMERLIQRLGGQLVREVDTQTTHLLVGERSWPLNESGRLTANLRKARRRQRAGQAIAIVREGEFLSQLGFMTDAGIRRSFTLNQLAGYSGQPMARLRAWLDQGLLQPAEIKLGVPLFDYRQVSGLRHLARLLESGVPASQIARSLKQVRRWLPAADEALGQLVRLAGSGRLCRRLADGRLAELNGQLLLEFDEGEPCSPLSILENWDTEELADLAFHWESNGRQQEAAELYRELLQRQPHDGCLWLNYGNTLHALDDLPGACDAFRQATECSPGDPSAWNNFGAVLCELGETAAARQALEQALRLDPNHAEAHFNLADLYRGCGDLAQAEPHEQQYRRCIESGQKEELLTAHELLLEVLRRES